VTVSGDSDVRAATAGNTVTLIGHVRTAAEHDAVVLATWRANGVYAVIDEIHVTGLRPAGDLAADRRRARGAHTNLAIGRSYWPAVRDAGCTEKDVMGTAGLRERTEEGT
jgi:hypothetical protein